MFHEPSAYPFTEILKSNWKNIRDEFKSLPRESFDAWVQQEMHGKGWSVFGLYALGNRIESVGNSCPKTIELIEKIEGVSLAGFSLLAPNTHIMPHVGWAKSVYRLHLGLVVPSGCGLRVANETREWKEGECLLFDDTVEHEAWNKSNQYRATLMLDFLRPGIDSFADDDIPENVREYAKKLLND